MPKKFHKIKPWIFYLLFIVKPSSAEPEQFLKAGKPNRSGRLSTVNLLVITSLDQLIFILQILFAFVTKHAAIMRRSTELNLPLSVSVPC